LKSGFWKGDWLLGLGVVVAFTAANLSADWIPSLEAKSFAPVLKVDIAL